MADTRLLSSVMRRALDMLQQHQWAGDDLGSGYAICPECRGLNPEGHAPGVGGLGHAGDCALAALLAELEAEVR